MAFAPVRRYINMAVVVNAAMKIHCRRIRRDVPELKGLAVKKILPGMTWRPLCVEQLVCGGNETRRLLRLVDIIDNNLLYGGIRSDDIEEPLIEGNEIRRRKV